MPAANQRQEQQTPSDYLILIHCLAHLAIPVVSDVQSGALHLLEYCRSMVKGSRETRHM
jgi:hypothetical protein